MHFPGPVQFSLQLELTPPSHLFFLNSSSLLHNFFLTNILLFLFLLSSYCFLNLTFPPASPLHYSCSLFFLLSMIVAIFPTFPSSSSPSSSCLYSRFVHEALSWCTTQLFLRGFLHLTTSWTTFFIVFTMYPLPLLSFLAFYHIFFISLIYILPPL